MIQSIKTNGDIACRNGNVPYVKRNSQECAQRPGAAQEKAQTDAACNRTCTLINHIYKAIQLLRIHNIYKYRMCFDSFANTPVHHMVVYIAGNQAT